MHTIHVDKPRNLIVMTISGYWTREVAIAACADARTAIATLGAGAGQHDMLCNLTDAQIAPGDTIAAVAGVMGDPAYADIRARRLALYTPSALFRMQLDRLAQVRPGIAVFYTSAAAYRWLQDERRVLAA